jgi:hypothetical protein
MKGDIIKADVIDVDDDGVCTIIIYTSDSETLKDSFYKIKDKWFNNEEEVVISFKIPLKEVPEVSDDMINATVIGFNFESGVTIQVVHKESDAINLTFMFSDEDKEKMEPAMVKAMLLNK